MAVVGMEPFLDFGKAAAQLRKDTPTPEGIEGARVMAEVQESQKRQAAELEVKKFLLQQAEVAAKMRISERELAQKMLVTQSTLQLQGLQIAGEEIELTNAQNSMGLLTNLQAQLAGAGQNLGGAGKMNQTGLPGNAPGATGQTGQPGVAAPSISAPVAGAPTPPAGD